MTVFGKTEARLDRIGALSIAERPDIALASLAARRERLTSLEAAAPAVLGTALPGVSRVAGGTIRAFWTGPAQWLVEAPYDTHEDLAAVLKQNLGGDASITEQSDGWCAFDIEGDATIALLERLCAADTRAMTPGDVLRTTIEHMGCFLICEQAGHAFRLWTARSSALSLHHALTTVAAALP
ncbi:sarcosine oxidase subunit gamma [Zavarzinia aquatilis]|uniref:Sarcosine oxidase subunit gamma n=1 Tax=Zavarzinia aquatilis TaxID=2211142 RepID=A0A317EGC4_9PROT|nr:sarcosine oxidase subunit gamma [Zavarzinia aquatilis]